MARGETMRGRAWAGKIGQIWLERYREVEEEKLYLPKQSDLIVVKWIPWKWRTEPRSLVAISNGNSLFGMGEESSVRKEAGVSVGIKMLLCMRAWYIHQGKFLILWAGNLWKVSVSVFSARPMNYRVGGTCFQNVWKATSDMFSKRCCKVHLEQCMKRSIKAQHYR